MTLGKALLYLVAPVLDLAYEHQIITGIVIGLTGLALYSNVAPHILIGWR